MASGEIVAFLDDDAVADDRWIEELVAAYARHDADAVGGRMAPRWIAGQPQFLPEEFYFLIGVTHRGFPTTEREVRNTFSSNLSFRRDVFLELGGFREHMGKRGSNDLQGGETELCVRLRETTDSGVIYTPEAVVTHKVFDHRTKLGWLIRRAFWQGYSKRMMQSDLPVPIDREWGFLGQLLTTFIPHRMWSLLRRPSVTAVTQLATLGMLVLAVGVGYLYGIADDLS
jgi:GT2 family glycosyltransferase